jgi:hypothetical protein
MSQDKLLECICAEATSTRTREERIFGFPTLLGQPFFNCYGDVGTQRRASHLAAFPDAADVSAGAKFHVLPAEGRDLAIAQAGLNCKQQERSVPPPHPGGRIWCRHQGLAFLFGHELHRTTLEAFRRNCQNALAMQCQCRFADGYVLEECVQSRQAVIPRPRTVAADEFEMFEELSQKRCVESSMRS